MTQTTSTKALEYTRSKSKGRKPAQKKRKKLCAISQESGEREDIMKLKEFREKRGYTQRQLADLCGMPIHRIQHYECGFRDIDSATLETLVSIALALDVPMYDLIEDRTMRARLMKAVGVDVKQKDDSGSGK